MQISHASPLSSLFITALCVVWFRLISRPSSFPFILNFIPWYFLGVCEVRFRNSLAALSPPLTKIMISTQLISVRYCKPIFKMWLVLGRFRQRLQFYFTPSAYMWRSHFTFFGFVRIVLGGLGLMFLSWLVCLQRCVSTLRSPNSFLSCVSFFACLMLSGRALS